MMQFQKGFIYHIYNQGNKQQNIFFNRDNYLYFLHKIRIHIQPYADVLAWCLMPNRFHLLVRVREIELSLGSGGATESRTPTTRIDSINKSIGILLASYTRAVNNQNSSSGSLFRQKTKAECLNCTNKNIPLFIKEKEIYKHSESVKDFLQICFDYIHQLPVIKGLVKNACDWEFSSAKDYAGLRNGKLVNKKLWQNYQARKFVESGSATESRAPAPPTTNIIIDSRSIVLKDNVLFAAIKGKHNDGHNYVLELYNKGVRKFLLEYIPQNAQNIKDAQFIKVKNTLKTLQDWAALHRKSFDYPVVAITGSNGKTIVKEWIFQILANDLRIIRNPKSYNSQIGVALSVLLMKKNDDLAIFEAGISQYHEMVKLKKIIEPDIGIFTNIGDAHQENFKNIDDKIYEKLKLFYHSKLLIYCKDHLLIHKAIQKKINQEQTQLFTWSFSQEADLKIIQTCKQKNKTKISFSYQNQITDITIPFTDNAAIENTLHVLAFILSQNLYSQEKNKLFEYLTPVAMRLEMLPGINNCTLINDTYNSDLNSIQIAFDVLHQQSRHLNKSLIISDVLQSGQDEKELYGQLATMINKAVLNKIILVGEKMFRYRNLFKGNIYNYPDTESLIQSKELQKFHNEAILLKAARKFRFDRINEIMQQKNHRTILEINMENMLHNLNYYRSLLNKNTKIMVMVKAFSYGSGTYEIASWLAHQKVDYLGVAYIDEGIYLRKSGISLPIMVMNPNFESFMQLIEYKLEPEIYSFTSLKVFNQIAQKHSVHPYPVHIKIDTGMHRLGFEMNEIKELIRYLKQSKFIQVKSVFSHLAASDEVLHDCFTQKQIKDFRKMSNWIKQEINDPFYRHILNSSGIERFSDAQFEMVRLGIGLYGISPNNQLKLKNVSTLKTHISQIKKLKAGETVGYSRMGKIKKDTKIAILPIGYADGLNRKLSNGIGQVFINGKYAAFIGNICMDMSMIDLKDIPANEGDEVIIFGEQISVNQLANQIESIPYEVFTSISSRVKRVYLH